MTRTGPGCLTRQGVRERDGSCVICGEQGEQIHHRSGRRMGGSKHRRDINSMSNLILLCAACHRHVEAHPGESRAAGWIVPSWQDPAGTALSWHDRTVWLNADGTTTEVPWA